MLPIETAAAPRGWIVPVGGAERKSRDSGILARFVELCGGRSAEIAVIPTASQALDTGERYARVLRSLDVLEAESVRLEDREDSTDAGVLALLQRATGVFMTGGNQVRLSRAINDTPVARLLRERNAQGMPVGGTSAGAAFLCETMIAMGRSGSAPRHDMVSLAHGLGLTDRVVIDQHFRQRDRLGRLLTAVARTPSAIGLGIDEDTAAFIGPDDAIEVVGSGGVTVIDLAGLVHSSLDETAFDRGHDGGAVSLLGVTLHILAEGDRYDLRTRTAHPGG